MYKEKARRSLIDFVLYTNPLKDDNGIVVGSTYNPNWHHIYLAKKLDQFERGLIKNLIVAMPPQHGKSRLVSEELPAFGFGKNPDIKIIGASYADDLATRFNRNIQQRIDSTEYIDLFPNTRLNASNVKPTASNSKLRNADIFEIVDHSGFYKPVGVGGSLTGNPADWLIVDDPIKDIMEAYSQRMRDNIWDWYVNVAETRLHNDSQRIICMTRWHEDDLVGRLLASEPENWEVVNLPAIKENDDNPDDPRQIGEALWASRHSLERINSIRAKSERTFISLYQGRPSKQGGNIISGEWFKTFRKNDLPDNIQRKFRSDTAYGKEKSDNSATLCYSIHEGNLYIWLASAVNKPFPQFLSYYVNLIETNGYTAQSICYFEPKSTGTSAVQSLSQTKLSNGLSINVREGESPKDAKDTRIQVAASTIEGGHVYLLEDAPWVEKFILECEQFPNGDKDDQVDVLASIILEEMSKPKVRISLV